MRILATSDLHLGMAFRAYEEVGARLAEARFEAFDRLVDTANQESCDLFAIAGDLFERRSVPASCVSRAAETLSRFSGTAAVVLPGNHDYYAGRDASPWGEFLRRTDRAESQVFLAAAPEPLDLEDLGLPLLILPGPCTAKHSEANAIDWMPGRAGGSGPAGGPLAIGIAHGSIEGLSPDFDMRYYPMTTKLLEAKAVDLWVIGHTHAPFPDSQEPPPSGPAALFVPGTPEPDGFDCSHAGSAWIIEIEPGREIRAKLLTTGMYRFEEHSYEVQSLADVQAATDRIGSAGADVFARLELMGAIPSADYQRLAELLDAVRGRLAYLREDLSELSEEITQERIREEFTEGSFPNRLLGSFLESGDREAVRVAYELIAKARE